MSWETRPNSPHRYYTRSRREGGRIVREYVGRGPHAELMAEADRIARTQVQEERRLARCQREEEAALEARVAEADAVGELLARVALLATGHHRHHGGEWRRRRANQAVP